MSSETSRSIYKLRWENANIPDLILPSVTHWSAQTENSSRDSMLIDVEDYYMSPAHKDIEMHKVI